MKFLAVKDFAKHQHYSKRNPPWIKLYAAALTDLAFIQLPEAAQAQLMKIWILASQLGHPLPNDPKLIAGKIATTGRFYLREIIDAGFLILTDDVASKNASKSSPDVIANIGENATPLRRELEIELESSSSPLTVLDDESDLAARLETDADRCALTAIVRRARVRFACIGSLSAILSGNDPSVQPAPTLAVFGQALRDFAGNGEIYAAALFRGYLRRGDGGNPERQPRRGGVAQRTYENGLAALKDS